MTNLKESEIQSQILDYLKIKHIFHYRQNTGALETKSGRFMRFGCKGSPDIVCIINGRYVGVEVKASHGQQSPDQKIFEANLRNAGGDYWLVRSLEELISKLK